ncbi:uncharacterized protein LOC118185914, partial [Stegodyphus dumicola]|uniref:uncharacterized protein LOC118185914 n=1 Tax=Stegodyphus dumicola TaxID=202533 RepID=UPI0015AC52A1
MVKVSQLNLQHSKAASYNLAAQLGKQGTFVALIQEPRVYKGKTLGRPMNSHFSSSEGPNKRPRISIYISKNIKAMKLSQFTSEDLTAILTKDINSSLRGNICFCSVYMAYNLNILQEFTDLVSFCEINNIPMVIGGDVNAHHLSWGSSDTNPRGEKLMELIMNTNLTWVNRDNRSTFVNRRREEVIDLTLTSDIYNLIENWH